MNSPLKILMIATLLPAGLNPSLIASANGIALSLCGSAGASVTVPLGAPSLPGTNGSACCAKGCHGSQERKRLRGQPAT
ncbi:hypothetical protein MB02_04395 [Croceicoccus estronivorus]|nr:hypothetical protein MB02_04395 [Croceicoccus estronivorus]